MSKELNQIVLGYKKFHKEYFDNSNPTFANFVKLGQQPKVMVIACSDSRVVPSIIFDCHLGDLFVIRNVANLVPPFETQGNYHGTSAAIEFGVCNLGVSDIIILGHSYCGGIRALLDDIELVRNEGFISKWMEIAKTARDQARENHPDLSVEQQCDICSHYALKNSLNNLMTFPWIKEKVSTGDLSLHAWYFDLSSGIIQALNQEKDTFETLG